MVPGTAEIYPLSLHDALPILPQRPGPRPAGGDVPQPGRPVVPAGQKRAAVGADGQPPRSEEHTSELQSLTNLVCRLLLEKKKKTKRRTWTQGRLARPTPVRPR